MYASKSPVLSAAGIPLTLLQSTPRRHKEPYRASATPIPIPSLQETPVSSAAPSPPSSPSPSPIPEHRPGGLWPRLKARVAEIELAEAAQDIFGYTPRRWQLRAAIAILEGRDTMVVAGTGSGKSLVFALVAIAAGLVRSRGLVVVICPLKVLQLDQVALVSFIGCVSEGLQPSGLPPQPSG